MTTGIGIIDDYMASRERRRTLAASGDDGLENHPSIRDLQRRISELRAASGSSHDRRRRRWEDQDEREPDHNYSYDHLFEEIGRGGAC